MYLHWLLQELLKNTQLKIATSKIDHKINGLASNKVIKNMPTTKTIFI